MKQQQTLEQGPPKDELPLRELQRLMGSAILNPLTHSQKINEKLPNGKSTAEIARAIIKPNDLLTSIERLEIYNRQYWFRLIDCLYDDFPGLRAVLGERHFYNLIVAYLSKFPSDSYSLRDLGRHMVDFLNAYPRSLGTRSKIGLDMARFEWAQAVAFDSAAWPAIKPEQLTQFKPQDLRLHLQPYLSVLELSYPLDDLVIALHKERTHRAEASAEREDNPDDDDPIPLPPRQKIFLVVHRFDNSLYYKRVDRAAFELLRSIKSGTLLEDACSKALSVLTSQGHPVASATEQFRQWFETWSKLRWFCTPPSE